MDCDDVFVVLTRAPFPTGSAEIDTPTEEHLALCDGCHRLANALRPAPHLFHEALTPDQCRSLPGYWGEDLSGEAVLAEKTTRRAAAQLAPIRNGNARARQSRLQREAKRLLREEHLQVALLPQAACGWRDLVALVTLVVATTLGLGVVGWMAF